MKITERIDNRDVRIRKGHLATTTSALLLGPSPPSLLPTCTVQEKYRGVDGHSENAGREVLPPLRW